MITDKSPISCPLVLERTRHVDFEIANALVRNRVPEMTSCGRAVRKKYIRTLAKGVVVVLVMVVGQ